MADLVRLEQLGLDLAALTDDEIAAVVDGLNEAAAQELADRRPDNTKVAYEQDFAEWARFCREKGMPPELDPRLLPGLAALLQAFVKWMTEVGVVAPRRGEGLVPKPPAPKTLQRRVAGAVWTLRKIHGVNLVPLGVSGNAREWIRGYARNMVQARKQVTRGPSAIAIPLDELRAVALACDTSTLIGLRNRVMLVLWVYAGWRVSEIAARAAGEIIDTGRMLRVRCDWSKTGEKIARVTNKPDAILNPVALWREWLGRSGISAHMPAFPPIDRHGNIASRHMTRDGLRWVLIRMFEAAGSHTRVTAHSIRHTTVTVLVEAGTPRHLVESQVGFSSGSRTLGEYVDAAELDARNASHYMTL